MKYAARPDRELSDTPWSKSKTVCIHRFETNEIRRAFIEAHGEWIPVEEKLPELKKLLSEAEENPAIHGLPWPIRTWISPKSKESKDLVSHIEYYREDK